MNLRAHKRTRTATANRAQFYAPGGLIRLGIASRTLARAVIGLVFQRSRGPA